MSELQQCTVAVISLDYRGEDQVHLVDRRLRNYYNEARKFLAEIIEDVPTDKFEKDDVLNAIMKTVQENINNDLNFRELLIGLGENYPTTTPDPKRAQNYIRYLKRFSQYIALIGEQLIKNETRNALFSDMPYTFFCDKLLGNYTASCFHEYIARTTETYFKRNWILVRGRTGIHGKQMTIYFDMLRPLKDQFRELGKAFLCLGIYIGLQNSKDLDEFVKEPARFLMSNVDEQKFLQLYSAYKKQLEEFRLYLLQNDPEAFKPLISETDPAYVMATELATLRM